jgi:hypothetical protein
MGLPQLIFMPTIRECCQWNHKGPGNGQTPRMETNTLKIGIPTMIVAQDRKMVWNRLWNPIQRVYKGVGTTYFYANYPGTWSLESQRTLEWPNPTDGNQYTQHWYSNNDCGTSKQAGLEHVVESYSKGVPGGCHNLFACQLPGNVVHGITKDLGMAKPH